jgi:ubiquinone/menaquinone biosynthesis C-methylase UbiE
MPQHEKFELRGNAAELYERYAVPYIVGPWAPGLIEAAGLRPGEQVLDLACGTGVVTRLAAEKVGPTGHVTGLDLNAGMLAVARSLPPPPGATIQWVQGSAVAISLPDATFDAVVCQQGFQFFPDQPAALREMRRVLAPGGRVCISVWKSAGPYNIAVGDALEQHVDAATANRYRASRVVPQAHTLHQLLTDAGFREVQVRASQMTTRFPPIEAFVLHHLAALPVAEAVTALSDGQRAALARQVGIALRSYADGDGASLPDETHIAMAHT